MNPAAPLSRRTFLALAAQTAAVTLGGLRAGAAKEVVRNFTVAAEPVRGLAVGADGAIAVATDGAVLFHGRHGRLTRRIASARPVQALCFDARGRLFVTFQNQVARLNDAGAFEPVGPPLGGRDSALTGLAVADHGAIFAADSGQRAIWRLDGAGALLGAIKPAERGFAVTPVCFPIAWRNGRLLVAEPARHRVHSYTAVGERVGTWGTHSRAAEGFGGCCNPVAVAALADGSVVTAEGGQPRVKLFTAEGRFARLLAGPGEFAASERAAGAEPEAAAGCAQGLLDLAVSPEGGVVVLDRATRDVRILA